MKIVRWILCLLLFAAAAPSSSFGHFLWIAAGSQAKDGKVHVYFSETATPDDPELLAKVAKLQLWQLNKDGTGTLLKITQDADSFAAEPVKADGAIFTLSYDYGVMARGNETFLLKYHAKSQPSSNPQSWRAIANGERLPLELVARTSADQTIFTVLWQGKPLADATVTISGPGLEHKLDAPSNEKGEVSFALKSAGLFSVRAKHSEATPGELDGKVFSSIRHYATLALSLGNDSLTTATLPTTPIPASALPQLDQGLTSFGAAVVGEDVYIYGGHLGSPHHYSKAGQSDQFLKLNLTRPTRWEVVSKGPRRTGLAAVSFAGKFYRIGGFEARNEEADKQSLWSMPDFARFDPSSKQWEQLPSMPSGRSSHDALVIGDTLYVVGGWELQGEGNSKWHDTAYSVDLSAKSIEWKELPKTPFQRRALSLGEWQGKVYVIGGMQSEGGITTATAIYDPANRTWGEGPNLNGDKMEGFGSSAFLCGGKLCVSTFAGNLQILADDGSKWINSGKLTHPRFFHRMLPLHTSEALIIGGASMQNGKIRELETREVLTNTTKD